MPELLPIQPSGKDDHATHDRAPKITAPAPTDDWMAGLFSWRPAQSIWKAQRYRCEERSAARNSRLQAAVLTGTRPAAATQRLAHIGLKKALSASAWL